MREKEIWEEGRHGLEIINLCGKYFQNQEDVYFGYCKNLEEILTRICEDYSCYLPVEGVCVRPIVFCQYYIESFCRECRCCGNLGGAGLKKVNFSPVLEKKTATGLDGNLLVKLHNTHVLLNRILDPYHKVSLRLLTVIKVQELTREMEGFSGIARGNDLGLMELTGEFLIQGILLKLNKRKGLQNRIFFLFRDMLVYGTRVSSTHGFRLHGIILTRNMELLDSNISISSIPWSFSIIVRSSDGMGEDGDKPNEKILVLAAFSSKDHGLWVQSISSAIEGSVSPRPMATSSFRDCSTRARSCSTTTSSCQPSR
ncbi:FERM, RhoGEF and pleckstrin domain-containing protein 2 [Orchesella cincta]|uniref:FERM, RhoGEF and pleckstrin domain-containing protein 2 n=1 Tax=Orchesella cincta TaxID=48709 RepID=A0A1D2N2Q8_ORCCI|nr:FERM, RhoGEF and pleckstrin domain-containing protein 2 [Orchesella cincta]